MEPYQVKADKASGILNDPNNWSREVGNPLHRGTPEADRDRERRDHSDRRWASTPSHRVGEGAVTAEPTAAPSEVEDAAAERGGPDGALFGRPPGSRESTVLSQSFAFSLRVPDGSTRTVVDPASMRRLTCRWWEEYEQRSEGFLGDERSYPVGHIRAAATPGDPVVPEAIRLG